MPMGEGLTKALEPVRGLWLEMPLRAAFDTIWPASE